MGTSCRTRASSAMAATPTTPTRTATSSTTGTRMGSRRTSRRQDPGPPQAPIGAAPDARGTVRSSCLARGMPPGPAIVGGHRVPCHSARWYPGGAGRRLARTPVARPLRRVAKARGWRVWVITKSACQIADTRSTNRSCRAWREAAIRSVRSIDAAIVIVGGHLRFLNDDGSIRRKGARLWREGMSRTLRRLDRVARTVVLLGDTPRFGDPVGCLRRHRRDHLGLLPAPPRGRVRGPGRRRAASGRGRRGALPPDRSPHVPVRPVPARHRAHARRVRPGPSDRPFRHLAVAGAPRLLPER